MEAKGLKLACLYSMYGCQQVKRMKVDRYLLSFFRKENLDKNGCEFVIKILKKLQPYEGYCQIRCLKVQENPFSPDVVKAYWLGDTKLELGDLNHNFATLEKFKSIRTIEHLPDDIIDRMLDCAISFGKIIEVGSRKPRVLNHRLLYKVGRVFWGAETREVNTRFVNNLQKGDLVSIHWGIAREKISNAQTRTLEIITKEAIKTLQMA